MYTHTLAYLTLCSPFHTYPLNKTVLKIRLTCQSLAATPEEQWLYKKLLIISLKKTKTQQNPQCNIKIGDIPRGKSRFTVITTCQIHLKTDLTESPKPSESSIWSSALCKSLTNGSFKGFCDQRFGNMYPSCKTVVWQHVPRSSPPAPAPSWLPGRDVSLLPAPTLLFLACWSLSCHRNTLEQFIFLGPPALRDPYNLWPTRAHCPYIIQQFFAIPSFEFTNCTSRTEGTVRKRSQKKGYTERTQVKLCLEQSWDLLPGL